MTTSSPSKTARDAALGAGLLKRIHVNQHVIRRNAKAGEDEPPISVKTSHGTFVSKGVVIDGASIVRYSPDKPLACGAKVWIETRARVSLTED